MEQQGDRIALEEKFEHLLEGLNAMGLMTLGLMQAQDPYADGINVLYIYLLDTAIEIKKLLTELTAK